MPLPEMQQPVGSVSAFDWHLCHWKKKGFTAVFKDVLKIWGLALARHKNRLFLAHEAYNFGSQKCPKKEKIQASNN